MASTISLHATGLGTPCCLTLFVFYCLLSHKVVVVLLFKVLKVNALFFLLPTPKRGSFSFRACCKLKDPSEGIGEEKSELKQHMLLLCTCSLKTDFYFTPRIAYSAPRFNSHLPIFGKSLRVFDKEAEVNVNACPWPCQLVAEHTI